MRIDAGDAYAAWHDGQFKHKQSRSPSRLYSAIIRSASIKTGPNRRAFIADLGRLATAGSLGRGEPRWIRSAAWNRPIDGDLDASSAARINQDSSGRRRTPPRCSRGFERRKRTTEDSPHAGHAPPPATL
jgi:hypothetical protein